MSPAIKGIEIAFYPFNLEKVEYPPSNEFQNGLCPELIPQQMF